MQNVDANSSQPKNKWINAKINRFIYIYTHSLTLVKTVVTEQKPQYSVNTAYANVSKQVIYSSFENEIHEKKVRCLRSLLT